MDLISTKRDDETLRFRLVEHLLRAFAFSSLPYPLPPQRTLTKAEVSEVELASIVESGQIKGMPRAAGKIPTVPNSPNVNLRINVRAALKPGQAGNFADGVIGATADRERCYTFNARQGAGKRRCGSGRQRSVITMTVAEKTLGPNPQPLEINGELIGNVRMLHQHRSAHEGLLQVSFRNGATVDLPSCIDFSQRLESPRVFVLQGTSDHAFVIFGGEITYWISRSGAILQSVSLFRDWKYTEYWTTEFLQVPKGLAIIYEAGVLVLDPDLQVRWHRKKCFNDILVGIEADHLTFIEDHESRWSVRLQDGNEVETY